MRIRPRLLTTLLVCALPAVATAQTTYTWQNSNTLTWGDSTAWSPSTVPNDLNKAIAAFGNVTTANSASIGSGNFSVRGITFDNTGGDWDLFGGSSGQLSLGKDGLTWTGGGTSNLTANLRIAADQTWDVGTTSVTQGGSSNAGVLSGYGTLTKKGSGTLTLDSQLNTFTGKVVVSAGTLTVGSTTNSAASSAVRNTAVTLSAGTTVQSGGSTASGDLRIGQVSGSGGTLTVGTSNTIHELSLADSTFSGTVVAGLGLNLRGIGNQTFNGNTTGLGTATNAAIAVNSGATLTLSGTGDSSSGVLGSTAALALRGGGIVFDNSGGNTSASGGRVADSVAWTSTGGRLSLIGNSAGSSETVGNVTLNVGQTTFAVTGNSSSAATTLALGTITRGSTNTAVAIFSGSGTGTLGASGNTPHISISGASSGFVGPWAVSGGHYAFYSSTVGSVRAATTSDYAQAYTSSIGTNLAEGEYGTLDQSSGTSNVTWSGTSGFGGGNGSYLRINPGASGQSLTFANTSNSNVNLNGILLAGDYDYTITQNTSTNPDRRLTGLAGPRLIGVLNANTTLTFAVPIGGAGNAVVKYGDGFLNLTADNSGSNFIGGSTSPTIIYLNGGTLRATLGSSGSLPNAATGIGISFRGGVLEIAGGSDGSGASADFTRSLTTSSTSTGRVNWDNNTASDRGDGGFSAFGSNASVNIGGNATPSSLTWNNTYFVRDGYALLFGSAKSDARIRFLNPITLGSSTATSYWGREFRVIDNPNSAKDYARIDGVISGTTYYDLVKTGSGTLELAAANTYAGNTLVAQGTLRVANDTSVAGSGTGTGQVVVYSGANLEGTGRISGQTTVLSGGSIRGGNSQDSTALNGTLTVGNTTIKNGGSLLSNLSSVDGNGSGTASNLAVGGNSLNFETGSVLKLTKDGSFSGTTAGTFTLATFTSGDTLLLDGVKPTDPVFGTYAQGTGASGAVTIDPSALSLADGDKLTLKRSGNNLVLVFTPVPEPAALMAACGLAAGSVAVVRRLRRKPAEVTLALRSPPPARSSR